MALLLAPIQIGKRNRLTRSDRMLKLSEVPDGSFLRSSGMIRSG
jgi:hypothetical protein